MHILELFHYWLASYVPLEKTHIILDIISFISKKEGLYKLLSSDLCCEISFYYFKQLWELLYLFLKDFIDLG